jgi:phosphatidylglycerophosphate synthase
MHGVATLRKLPDEARFLDLSDYARPIAAWIARWFAPTPLRAAHVTLLWAGIGFLGACCYGAGGYVLALAGAAAMQAKNILDAVDGSLARLQNRPSRIGRFLDSIFDAVVAAALYVGLAVAVARDRGIAYASALAAAALMLGLLQGSVYNYFYVRYRARRGGDTTSHVKEALTPEDESRYSGRPAARRLLLALIWVYNWIYGWQDRLVQRVDAWAAAPLVRSGETDEAEALRDERQLLTATSALGPGLVILILDVYTVAGIRHLTLALELYMWTVALGGTLYTAALFYRLRRAAECAASTPKPG